MNERFMCEAVEQPSCAVRPKSGHGGARQGAGRKKSLLNCVTCCQTFLAKKSDAKYCSEKCRPRKIRRFACVRCGGEFERAQSRAYFCGKGCLSAHTSEVLKDAARKKGPPAHRKRTCQHCGVPFISRRPGSKARKGLSREGVFCSRKCSADSIRKYATKQDGQKARDALRRAQLPPVSPKQCRCGEWFVPRQTGNVYCKATCSPAIEYKSVLSSKPTLCKKCSSSFIPVDIGRSKFCSKKCTKEYHRNAAGKTHRKRARYYGVAYEYINLLKVLERDNYKCQVCGCKTPKRLRGSIDDRAPELDHRIPMAMGGGHLWSNVQCACRMCNLAKGGTRIAGQTNFFEVMQPPRRHNNVKAERIPARIRDSVGQGA